MKAGKYWIGDLCYILGNDKDWNQICAFMGNGNHPREGVFTLNGVEGAIFGTAYGDGVYYDQEKNEYGVDSGTLGIFPAGVSSSPFESGGHVFEFPEDFTVACVDGEMQFGHVRIKTKAAAEPKFAVQITKKGGETRTFELEVVDFCYSQNDSDYPGVRIKNPEAVGEFCGDEFASESINFHYSEGSSTVGEYEDMDTEEILFKWKFVDEEGNSVSFDEVETAVFDHYLIAK